ncbi:hypothetical protein ABID92_002050 [Frigoribacterium sp. PvP120]|uniref:hypothetical protein n=1 Tax=unclassified Frigoribacterium TaxID=2627005 RepID=UPI001AEB33F7|nr:hypothetical protein [Frigoribacterium sp. PvP121]MBP1240352.1 hypothetical protein [Frigoribacterium sp. PvP121]
MQPVTPPPGPAPEGIAAPPHRAARLLRWLWIAGFAVGTTTHVTDLVVGGADVYADFHPALRAFWVSLTLWDPLVIVLLLLRRRAGVVLGLVVILTDIAVNWSVIAVVGGIPVWGAVNQTAFAALLLASARLLARWFAHDRPTPGPDRHRDS